MSEQTFNGLLVALYVLGVGLRVFWPYMLAYLQEGVAFNWRFVIGQVVGALIGLFGVLSAQGFLSELGAVGLFGSFVAGYGAASVGRDGQKTYDYARSSK